MAEEGESEAGFRIEGRVQGVGFRWWTRKTGGRLGLTGAVRNLVDGAVEVRARGPSGAVDRLEELLHDGPGHAEVESVRRIDSELDLRDGTFRIVH